jgi:hypothetical protein
LVKDRSVVEVAMPHWRGRRIAEESDPFELKGACLAVDVEIIPGAVLSEEAKSVAAFDGW